MVQHAPVGVGHHVDQQNHIVQDSPHFLGVLVSQGPNQLDGSVNPLRLGPVNAGVDEYWDFEVLELVDHLLRFFGILQHKMAQRLILAESSHGLGICERHQKQVSPTRRLAHHVDVDPIAVRFDLVQGWPDFRVRDQVML